MLDQDISAYLSRAADYSNSLLSNISSGDPTAVIIMAGGFIILLALVFKVSAFLFGLIKRGFLFIVIGLSVFYFATTFWGKFFEQGLTPEIIVGGAIGFFVAVSALVIAVGALLRHTKTKGVAHSAPDFTPTQLQQPHAYTSQALTKENLMQSLQDDRSLLAVLSYVIIAQFGVFSSRTISAPNPEVGMIFFVVFFIGAFIFIKTTYHNYLKGISHLIVASIFGAVISVLLGIYWAEFPVETILSIGYFATDAMVAFVTGIAVSLLMGSKH